MKVIPVFEPYLLGTETNWIEKAVKHGDISGTSRVVSEFEKRFSDFCGSPFAIAVSNGTSALHLALMALGVKPGDEIILPNFTIISNALSVIWCGAKPVFVDVSDKDGCLDSDQIIEKITKKTVGIMAVHMYGNACDMEKLSEITSQRGLWLLEDAAQAIGGSWKGIPLGTLGDVGTFSFYANKVITTGEGGAVICRDSSLNEKMRTLRNLSFNSDPENRFIHVDISHNYRLSGVQAAMGIAQIEGIEKLLEHRVRLQKLYSKALSSIPHIKFFIPDNRSTSAFWMQTLCVESQIDILQLQRRLLEVGIETRRFFYPLHRQPPLRKYHDQWDKEFPVSQKLYDRGIYLPSSSHLTEEEVHYIAAKLSWILGLSG